jgi:hypothetical protein
MHLKKQNQIINIPFDINDVFIEDIFFNYTLKDEEKKLILCPKYLKQNNFFRLEDKIYKEARDLYFEVHSKNNINRYYLGDEFSPKQESIKFNKGIFEDSDKERIKYLESIDELIKQTQSKDSNLIKTGRNLLFFSVYFDNGYIDLFDLCLKTLYIKKFNKHDILIITDEATRKIILNLNIIQYFNVHFLITSTPADSCEASMNKCLLYNFDKIFDYEKIFLLDVDIMCMDDPSIIFDIPICENQIYSARQMSLTYQDFRKKYHGFACIPDSFIEHVANTNQLPFNAGQFLFLNNTNIKIHFDNINKFMKEWTGNYFYEQCFLNYYFCKANMVMSTELDRFVSLVSPHNNKMKNNLSKNTKLIHFIGPSGKAEKKIEAIEKYLNKDFYASLFKT